MRWIVTTSRHAGGFSHRQDKEENLISLGCSVLRGSLSPSPNASLTGQANGKMQVILFHGGMSHGVGMTSLARLDACIVLTDSLDVT